MPTGFLGLGVMGRPMALNLVRAGHELVVWNRSPAAAQELRSAGARVASDPAEVFAGCEVVLAMLAHEEALDATLSRGTQAFRRMVHGRTLVHLGTTSPGFSRALGADVQAAGGRYAEAPVSGSRPVAEAGELVVMLGAEDELVRDLEQLLAPLARLVVPCGPPPQALLTKLAVNVFLIAQVTGLAEAFHFAAGHGLDLTTFQRVLDAGPMASTVSRAKLAKLVTDDLDVQAAVADVSMNNRLIVDAARQAGLSSPLLEVCDDLYRETVALGLGGRDMAAVVRAIEQRSTALSDPPR